MSPSVEYVDGYSARLVVGGGNTAKPMPWAPTAARLRAQKFQSFNRFSFVFLGVLGGCMRDLIGVEARVAH